MKKKKIERNKRNSQSKHKAKLTDRSGWSLHFATETRRANILFVPPTTPLKKALKELKHASVIKIHQEKGFICLRGRLLTRYIVSQSQNRHEV